MHNHISLSGHCKNPIRPIIDFSHRLTLKETSLKMLTGHLQLQTWSITFCILYSLSHGLFIFRKIYSKALKMHLISHGNNQCYCEHYEFERYPKNEQAFRQRYRRAEINGKNRIHANIHSLQDTMILWLRITLFGQSLAFNLQCNRVFIDTLFMEGLN